jgi:hypothetical protein
LLNKGRHNAGKVGISVSFYGVINWLYARRVALATISLLIVAFCIFWVYKEHTERAEEYEVFQPR